LLGQSKFEGLTFFRDVNKERVDNVLVTVAHSNCPVEDAYTRFTYVTLKDMAPVIRNQWEDRIQNFKVFDILRYCWIYSGQIRL